MLNLIYEVVGYIALGLIALYLVLASALPLFMPSGVALGLVHTAYTSAAQPAAQAPGPPPAMVDLAAMEQILIRCNHQGAKNGGGNGGSEIKLLIDRRLLGSPRLLILAPKHFTIVPVRHAASAHTALHAPRYG